MPAPNTANESPARGLSTFITAPAPVFTPQGKAARTSSGASRGTLITLRSVASENVANDDCWKNEPYTGVSPRRRATVPSTRTPHDLIWRLRTQ